MANEGHVVTGYQGVPHVKASDVGFYNAGTFGLGRYVLATGNKFSATINTRNIITISTGDIVNQGRHINMSEAHSLTVENAPVEYTKVCRIVMRYNKQPSTGIESAHLMLLEGTPSQTTPAPPDIITGNIFDGSTTDDVLLYEFTVGDMGIASELTTKFSILAPVSTLNTRSKSNQNRLDVLEAITEGAGTIGSNANISGAIIKRCTFLKRGNVVFVNLMLYTNDASALLPKDTTLFTAPAGFCPASTTMLSGTCSTGGIARSTLFNIFANGDIHQLNFTDCTMVQLSAIYKV